MQYYVSLEFRPSGDYTVKGIW